eukprot:11641000-Alexandrium_andersonii.AAC.1
MRLGLNRGEARRSISTGPRGCGTQNIKNSLFSEGGAGIFLGEALQRGPSDEFQTTAKLHTPEKDMGSG